MKIKFVDLNKGLVAKVKKAIPHFECVNGDIFDQEGVIVSASNPSFTFGGGLDKAISDKYPKECKEKQEKKGGNERIGDIIFTITVNDSIKSSKILIREALQSIFMYGEESETILLSGLGTAIGGLSEDDFIDVLKDFFPTKAYKGMDKGKCRGMEFEVGKTYKEDACILCDSGFHYCQRLEDIYSYYNKGCEIYEIEVKGEVDFGTDKDCSKSIKVIRHLDEYEVQQQKSKSNTGDRNTGNRNTGNRNTGDRNTGDRNTGNWNTGNWNTGYINTETPKMRIFDKQTKLEYGDISFPDYFYFDVVKWIYPSDMTSDEKIDNPLYGITDGFLKAYEYKEAWINSFNKADKSDIKKTMDIPNFTYKKFEVISGISKKMIEDRLKS